MSTAPLKAFWTKERLEKAALMWKRGKSGGEIAVALGCKPIRVYDAIYNHYPQYFPRRVKKQALLNLQKQREGTWEQPNKPNLGVNFKHLQQIPFIVVPMSYERALLEDRCLFFAANPMSEAGPLMPVCGCKRAKKHGRPYCAHHLSASIRDLDDEGIENA